MEAPDAIKWLNDLGVEFDKAEDGTMVTTHGGGTSRKRMHAAKDYSGSEIMRTIRDEVLNLKIPVVEFTSAVELLKDEKVRLPVQSFSTWKPETIPLQEQKQL